MSGGSLSDRRKNERRVPVPCGNQTGGNGVCAILRSEVNRLKNGLASFEIRCKAVFSAVILRQGLCPRKCAFLPFHPVWNLLQLKPEFLRRIGVLFPIYRA